MISYFRRNCRL